MEIQGRVFIVLPEYLEYFKVYEDVGETPIFQVGDRVIALENEDRHIWCVKESRFDGSYTRWDYPDWAVDVLYYYPGSSENDMCLAEES